MAADEDEDRLERDMFRALSEEIGCAGAAHVLGVFLASNTRRLDAMRRSVGAGDREAVEREAHSMKSAAATFGFRELSDMARRLERDAEFLGYDDLVCRIGELSAAFAEAEKAAQQTLAEA